MTIRVYSAADELVGNTALGRKFARFELIVASRLALQSKPMFRKIEFGVAGTSDAAVEAGGVQIAEEILAMTAAKAMKFSKVLGHYRQDEVIPVLAPNHRSLAVIGHSPDPDDSLEAVNLTISIPHFTSDAATCALLIGTRSVAGGTAMIGYCRWGQQNETTLEACYSELYRGVNIFDMEKIYNEPFTSDNTENGLGDGGSLGPDL